MSEPCNRSHTFSAAEVDDRLAQAEPLIRGVVSKSIGARSDREDILQEVRVAVWRSLERFDPSRSASWETWSAAVAKTICRRYLSNLANAPATHSLAKTEDIETSDSNDDVHDSPWAGERDDDCPLFAELHNAIRRALIEPALQRLTANSREVVVGIVLDGLSPARVASGLGRTVKDAKLFMRNAARTLNKPAKKSVAAVKPKKTRRPASSLSSVA